MTHEGADYCFQCVGKSSLVEEAYASCRKGCGKAIILGVDQPGFIYQRENLKRLLFGGVKPKSDITVMIEHYIDNKLVLKKFVTHEVSFEDINEAFDLLVEGKRLRCV